MNGMNLKTISIIAIILGASGFILGGISMYNTQTGALDGQDGADGSDGNDGLDGTTKNEEIITYINGTLFGYSCNTEAEINAALDDIGNGYGIITIVKNITLTQTIEIDGGGSYIIQGLYTIIDCNGDRPAFNLTNAQSCKIQNLKIDASDLLTDESIIFINETNDNPVNIDNIEILGDFSQLGIGIVAVSNNVQISNCFISQVGIGLVGYNGKNYKFSYNRIIDCYTWGVEILNSNNSEIVGNYISTEKQTTHNFVIKIADSIDTVVANNIIKKCYGGVEVRRCIRTLVSDNSISNLEQYGLYFEVCNHSICSGNILYVINSLYSSSGIGIFSSSYFNTLVGNGCFECHCTGIGTGYGIVIGFGCSQNIIVGNTCLNNDDNYDDGGSLNTESGNNFS